MKNWSVTSSPGNPNLQYLIKSLPTNGHIVGVNVSDPNRIVPSSPSFIYIPDQDFIGKDSFTYTVSGQTRPEPTLVRISVDVPAPPRATNLGFIVLAFFIAIVLIANNCSCKTNCEKSSIY